MDRPIIAITGSSGLIGSALVQRMAGSYHVIGFDREGPPHPPEEAECITIDLASDESVRASFEDLRRRHGTHLASVIHLAAYYSFSKQESPKYDAITVRGTERLLNALKDFQVDQFIFSSTMLVHKPCQPGEQIDEKWPMAGPWGYPRSKIETEELIRRLRGSMPVAMLRISGVYTDYCESIPISHHIQRIYERQLTSHFYPGRFDHGQAFMHLDDLIDALALTIERRAQLPPEFVAVVGEERPLSFNTMQSTIARLLYGRSWPTFRVPKWAAKMGAWFMNKLGIGDGFIKPWMIDLADDHYALNTQVARSALHWAPKRSLSETLPVMLAHLKADPAQWYQRNDLTPVPLQR